MDTSRHSMGLCQLTFGKTTDLAQRPPAVSLDQRTFLTFSSSSLKVRTRDFPGGAVVKNPPANAGDMGPSPGPERCRGATKPVRHNY